MKREQVTVRLEERLVELARRKSFYTPGLTLNELFTQALKKYLEEEPLDAAIEAELPEKLQLRLKPGRRVGPPKSST